VVAFSLVTPAFTLNSFTLRYARTTTFRTSFRLVLSALLVESLLAGAEREHSQAVRTFDFFLIHLLFLG
jgi:hypothetical protein